MNIEKYTERARGFIQSAQMLAMREGHPQLQPGHLLKVLLDDPEGLCAGLIDRAGGRAADARRAVEAWLGKQPKVSGGASQPQATRDLLRLFETAEKAADKAGDSYVTVERLLLALAIEKDADAGRLLIQAGVTAQGLNAAIVPGDLGREFVDGLTGDIGRVRHHEVERGLERGAPIRAQEARTPSHAVQAGIGARGSQRVRRAVDADPPGARPLGENRDQEASAARPEIEDPERRVAVRGGRERRFDDGLRVRARLEGPRGKPERQSPELARAEEPADRLATDAPPGELAQERSRRLPEPTLRMRREPGAVRPGRSGEEQPGVEGRLRHAGRREGEPQPTQRLLARVIGTEERRSHRPGARRRSPPEAAAGEDPPWNPRGWSSAVAGAAGVLATLVVLVPLGAIVAAIGAALPLDRLGRAHDADAIGAGAFHHLDVNARHLVLL